MGKKLKGKKEHLCITPEIGLLGYQLARDIADRYRDDIENDNPIDGSEVVDFLVQYVMPAAKQIIRKAEGNNMGKKKVLWMALQDNEDRAEGDCGCVLTSDPKMYFCALHDSAEELCKSLAWAIRHVRIPIGIDGAGFGVEYTKATALIAKLGVK